MEAVVTVWKFQNFTATQILREIKFSKEWQFYIFQLHLAKIDFT